MSKEREPVEAVLVRKEKYEGMKGVPYGKPGHADCYKVQYIYSDGNRDRKYNCWCTGKPPQSIYLVGGFEKHPLGEFARRSTTNRSGFVHYRDDDSISGRMVGWLFVPGVVAVVFILGLLLLKAFGM